MSFQLTGAVVTGEGSKQLDTDDTYVMNNVRTFFFVSHRATSIKQTSNPIASLERMSCARGMEHARGKRRPARQIIRCLNILLDDAH